MIDIPTLILALLATASAGITVGAIVGIRLGSDGWRGLFDRLIGCLERLERRRAEEEGDWWKE